MEWLVVWLLFGFTAAIIATNKGRSGCGWFALGVILGPFGLILSLIVAKEEQVLEQRTLQSGGHRKCPYCAEVIKQEAIVCKHCGRDVPIHSVSTKDAPTQLGQGDGLENLTWDSLAELGKDMGLKVKLWESKVDLIDMIREQRRKDPPQPTDSNDVPDPTKK